MIGLDFATGPPRSGVIKRAGYNFVVRYICQTSRLPAKMTLSGDTAKWRKQYQDHLAAGLAVVLNWESTADRMKAGLAAGRSDAKLAAEFAQILGHPSDRPIYFSADWDATPQDQAAIDAYLDGCAEHLGRARVGLYGGYWPVKRALDAGKTAYAWQTGAWSGGRRDQRIRMFQRIGYSYVDGIQCDTNEALRADFGQHPKPGVVAQSAGSTVIVKPTEDDMTPDEMMTARTHNPVTNTDETFRVTIEWMESRIAGWIQRTVAPVAAQVAALSEVVARLSAGDDVDVAAVQAAAEAGARKALAEGVVQVDVSVQGGQPA